MGFRLPTAVKFYVLMLAGLAAIGCEEPQSMNTHGAAAGAASPAAENETGIPADLIATHEELIRIQREYIALAEKVQTPEDFKTHIDSLLALAERESSLVQDVMIAENKLSAAQKVEFDNKYYEPISKPVVAEVVRQRERIYAIGE